MESLRKHGKAPFGVVVVHGGPGARGEMEPVARELSKTYGVLEPFQTESTVEGQAEELGRVVEENAAVPVALIGWSWGAWLCYLTTARYPSLVKKLILVGSGPFEESYAKRIMEVRLGRLSVEERDRVGVLMGVLQTGRGIFDLFKEFGELMDKADSYNPLPGADIGKVELQPEIYEKVWGEASDLRSSGELLERGKNITGPVVAIHGDFDPHPSEGVKIPLSRTLRDFRFVLLEHCGHTPWREAEAKDKFYEAIRAELG